VAQNNRPAWRHDIDALTFTPEGHGGFCAVHRLAFRALLEADPTPENCVAYFGANEATFRAAAQAKIRDQGIVRSANFHLTSRDLRA
jgi:hypothetical protein